MGLKVRNILIGWVILGILSSLLSGTYANFESAYDLDKSAVDSEGNNVVDKINQMNLINGSSTLIQGIYEITGSNNPIDLVGGLISVGIGFIKTITGVITIPVELFGIITGFYFIPPIVKYGIIAIFTILIGIVLLDKYTQSEN